MRSFLIVLLVLFQLSNNSLFSQESVESHDYSTDKNNEERKLFGGRDFCPLISGRAVAGVDIMKDLAELYTVELGFAFVNGAMLYDEADLGNYGTWISGYQWLYVASPVVTGEMHFLNRSYLEPGVDHSLEVPQFMLNVGVTGGIGASFLMLPFGLTSGAYLSTDFNDVFARFQIGWDLVQSTVSIGAYRNITKNGPFPNYLNSRFIEIRFFPWRILQEQ